MCVITVSVLYIAIYHSYIVIGESLTPGDDVVNKP